ncbi:oxidoreductase [Spirochaetia bacterium]|nr:oxidoreductase [Spirochaetia bacterium]
MDTNENGSGLPEVFLHGDIQVINARDIHEKLEVGRDFSNWIKNRIEKYGFEEGKDYYIYSPNLATDIQGGQNKKDYYLTIPTAKEIAMVQNNEAGRRIRLYLIKVEKDWNTPEMVMARAMQFLNKKITDYEQIHGTDQKQIETLQAQLDRVTPKALAYDRILAPKDCFSIRETVNAMHCPGLGEKGLIDLLLAEKFLYRDHSTGKLRPYAQKKDQPEQFRLVVCQDRNGHNYLQCKVTREGIAYLLNRFGKDLLFPEEV